MFKHLSSFFSFSFTLLFLRSSKLENTNDAHGISTKLFSFFPPSNSSFKVLVRQPPFFLLFLEEKRIQRCTFLRKQRTERVRERRKQVSHARESVRFVRCKRVRVNGARYATRTRRVRLAQPADYSNTTEERPRWDGSLNATMLPPVWVERAGSESACLGRARPLSDLVDMPIDTVYMSMDMPCRGTAKAMLSLSAIPLLSSCLLFPSLVVHDYVTGPLLS